MAELANSIEPFAVQLTEVQVVPTVFEGTDCGILWVEVQESGILRQLHNRLNTELSQRFANTQAPYDGPDYHFHMTAMVGGQPVAVYRKFYEELGTPDINVNFMAHELAMFVYDEPTGPDGEYMTYRILPLGKSAA